MKKAEIKIGSLYAAKVSGKIQVVQIDAESRFGGWDATSISTSHKVHIKGVQRLRYEVRKKQTPPRASLGPNMPETPPAGRPLLDTETLT